MPHPYYYPQYYMAPPQQNANQYQYSQQPHYQSAPRGGYVIPFFVTPYGVGIAIPRLRFRRRRQALRISLAPRRLRRQPRHFHIHSSRNRLLPLDSTRMLDISSSSSRMVRECRVTRTAASMPVDIAVVNMCSNNRRSSISNSKVVVGEDIINNMLVEVAGIGSSGVEGINKVFSYFMRMKATQFLGLYL
jgi:hypothetical protein